MFTMTSNSCVNISARIACALYRQSRDIKHFLDSDNSASRTNHLRIFALASIDILLTLPIDVVSLTLVIQDTLSFSGLSFYSGWAHVHADWEPRSASYDELKAAGILALAEVYFVHWVPSFLALAIFALFGTTSEACASYRRIICTVFGRFGRLGRDSARSLPS